MKVLLKQNKREGQSMLLMVLSIGAIILGSTTIAGILMVYQIRASSDFVNSSKAIFAADAGTEWAEYNHFNTSTAFTSLPSFSDASVTVTCYDASNVTIGCTDPLAVSAISKGSARNVNRAFMVQFMPTP